MIGLILIIVFMPPDPRIYYRTSQYEDRLESEAFDLFIRAKCVEPHDAIPISIDVPYGTHNMIYLCLDGRMFLQPTTSITQEQVDRLYVLEHRCQITYLYLPFYTVVHNNETFFVHCSTPAATYQSGPKGIALWSS